MSCKPCDLFRDLSHSSALYREFAEPGSSFTALHVPLSSLVGNMLIFFLLALLCLNISPEKAVTPTVSLDSG